VDPHGRWRSLPPEGAGRIVAGGARLLAPLDFSGGGWAAAPGTGRFAAAGRRVDYPVHDCDQAVDNPGPGRLDVV